MAESLKGEEAASNSRVLSQGALPQKTVPGIARQIGADLRVWPWVYSKRRLSFCLGFCSRLVWEKVSGRVAWFPAGKAIRKHRGVESIRSVSIC